MVLSRKHLSRMEIHWFLVVGSREAYVPLTIPALLSPTTVSHSGFWQEYTLVRRSQTMCRFEILISRVSSTVIEDIISLRDSGLASMAYFYCDFRDTSKQSRRDLLPSLVIQLSSRSDPCCDVLFRLYLEHDSGAQKPSEGKLMKCLKDMVTIPDQRSVYLIIDGLDECPDSSGLPSPREQVLGLLKELVELSLPNLHLCVTSRPEIDIRAALEPLTSRRVSLHDQTGQKKDIIGYVTSVVYSDTKMRRWRDEDKKLVIETLSERADGMYVYPTAVQPHRPSHLFAEPGFAGYTANWRHSGTVFHRAYGICSTNCPNHWMRRTSGY